MLISGKIFRPLRDEINKYFNFNFIAFKKPTKKVLLFFSFFLKIFVVSDIPLVTMI
jgi:hypothetical protein